MKRDIPLINDALADIYSLIAKRNLDISVLVNNAAVQYFSDFNEEDSCQSRSHF